MVNKSKSPTCLRLLTSGIDTKTALLLTTLVLLQTTITTTTPTTTKTAAEDKSEDKEKPLVCKSDSDAHCINVTGYCFHGGLCCNQDGQTKLYCVCPQDYEGERCDKKSSFISPLEVRDKISCPKEHKECNDSMKDLCGEHGVCCQTEHQTFCSCEPEWTGDKCRHKSFIMDALESHDSAMKMTLLSSGLSLTITTLALVALIIVTVMIVRRSRLRQQRVIDRAEDLDKEILFVQGELAKLSPTEKMTRLTRLSKIIEATARAALLSYPALISPPPGVARPRFGTITEQHLPRWSSAPCALDRPIENFANGTRQEIHSADVDKRSSKPVFIKKPLHQVFSL